MALQAKAGSGIAVYSATKSAVDRLTRVAAMEAGKLGYGVRVNCVYPGLFDEWLGVADVVRGMSRCGSIGDSRGWRQARTDAVKAGSNCDGSPHFGGNTTPTIDGLTYRQIGERLLISPRTVQTHLPHAL